MVLLKCDLSGDIIFGKGNMELLFQSLEPHAIGDPIDFKKREQPSKASLELG
jgi:hypothetical protein